MSEYQFKVGDKVKYKADEYQAAIDNEHDPYKVYTICDIEMGAAAYFEGEECCCLISRLELVQESTPETFDYRQALKILAENPEAEIEFSANGRFWGKVVVDGEIKIPTGKEFYFRIKPQPKKYQWLYKTKVSGQYFTTTDKFESKKEAEEAYQGEHLIFIKPLNEETI